MLITPEAVTRGLAEEVAKACASRTGATSALHPTAPVEGLGWLIVLPLTGAATGRLVVWFARESAMAFARLAKTDETDEAAVAALLRELVAGAARALEVMPAAAGLNMGDAVTSSAGAPAGALAYEATMAEGVTCRFAVASELVARGGQTTDPDTRLEAVLDVELPLIVRFGRAVMPLRALADLGPGAVVDMGRSPDEPVDLLVGDRLIARGEVVIVAGNYGVRITELTGGRQTTADLDMRAS